MVRAFCTIFIVLGVSRVCGDGWRPNLSDGSCVTACESTFQGGIQRLPGSLRGRHLGRFGGVIHFGLMLKAFGIATAFTALLFGRLCVAGPPQNSVRTVLDEARQTQRPTLPTHVVIDPPFPRIDGNQPSAAKQDESPEKLLPRFIRPEWVMVYVTIVYAFLAWLTLRAIRMQAGTMDAQAKDARQAAADNDLVTSETLAAIKRQADAMERQIAVGVSKERGRLRIEIAQPDLNPIVLETLANVSLYRLQLKIVLDGLTEVKIIESTSLARICTEGREPIIHRLLGTDWPSIVNPESCPIKAIGVVFVDDGSALKTGANEDFAEELRRGKKYFLFESRFRYRDIFGDIWVQRIKQRFDFIVIPDEVRAIMSVEYPTGRWNDAGDPDENGEKRQNPN
jgi:hypothetical protein